MEKRKKQLLSKPFCAIQSITELDYETNLNFNALLIRPDRNLSSEVSISILNNK